MWIGWIEFDVLLGDVHSLKQKRAVLRPLVAELKRATEASVAEVGEQDLHRRAAIGVAVAAAGADRVTEVLDRAERLPLARASTERAPQRFADGRTQLFGRERLRELGEG